MISGNATLESIHEIKLNKVRINNCMVLWRLGAYLDILELPLLAASSKVETALMVDKT